MFTRFHVYCRICVFVGNSLCNLCVWEEASGEMLCVGPSVWVRLCGSECVGPCVWVRLCVRGSVRVCSCVCVGGSVSLCQNCLSAP